MKAIVLTAGYGRRLRPLSDILPKPLLPIRGRPILGALLAGLAEVDVRDVRIVVGHLGDRIRRFAGDGSAFGVRVSYTEQSEPRGTAHALLAARDFIDSELMIAAGDTAFGPDHLRRLREFHAASGADATLCLKRVPAALLARTSSVALAPDGRVLDFVEKPEPGNAPGELAAGLLHIYPPALLRYLAGVSASPRGELELTDATRAMIADGMRVMGLELPLPPDLTDPEDLLRLNFDYVSDLIGGC